MTSMEPERFGTESAGEAELRATIARLRSLIKRRRRTFAFVFVVAALAIQAVAFAWPGKYQADAAILMQKTRLASGVDADPKQPTTVVTGTVSEEEVNSEVAVLTSRQVLERTMLATGLDKIPLPWYLRVIFAPIRAYERAYSWAHDTPYPTPAQRALQGMADSISVQRLKESNILVVSYRSGSPEFSEIVLNELLKHYLDWHVSVHRQMDVQPFFTMQAETLNQEVTKIQTELQALKATVNVADFATEREIALRSDALLREESLMLNRQLVELDAKLAAVRRSAAVDDGWTRTSTTTKPSSQVMDGLRNQILQLELEQVKLEARYTESSPLVREVRAKLVTARRTLEEERTLVSEESTTGLNPVLVTLQQDTARLTADRAGVSERRGIIERQIADSRERIEVLDQKGAEAERLALQLQSAKDRYLMYLDRTEKARVDAALDQSRVANVAVVQQASAPPKPVSPKRLTTLIVAIGGGFAIALLVCAWLELASMGMVGALASALPRPELAK
jgi:uncharacterized protein involved in exopolysaccharide biosynthesis